MTRARSRLSVYALINVAIIAALVIMLYPLIWMLSASFKTGYEIFHSLSLLPQAPTLRSPCGRSSTPPA